MSLLCIDIDKLQTELEAQELFLSEDQWMSVIVSLRRAQTPKNCACLADVHKMQPEIVDDGDAIHPGNRKEQE